MYRPADVLCAVGCQSALRQAADLPRASRPPPLTVLSETGPEFLFRPEFLFVTSNFGCSNCFSTGP